jgi:hypothetical protein
METGYEKYKEPETVEDDAEEGGQIEESIKKVRNACEHVYANADNGNMLDEILNMAESSFEKDKEGWEELLEDMKSALTPLDDEDDIAAILDDYEKKATLLV